MFMTDGCVVECRYRHDQEPRCAVSGSRSPTSSTKADVSKRRAIKEKRPVDKLSLMAVLLFRRYVKTTDTNSLNLLVAEDGQVLSTINNSPR